MNLNTIKNNTPYESYECLYPGREFVMFRCNKKKMDFYLKSNLANRISENQFELNFIPKGKGDSLLLNKENRCVVSGKTTNLTKHHIIPHSIIKFFDISIKRNNSYNVVAIDLDIHKEFEKTELKKFKNKLINEIGLPIKTKLLKEAAYAASLLTNNETFTNLDNNVINHCLCTVEKYRKQNTNNYISYSDIINRNIDLSDNFYYDKKIVEYYKGRERELIIKYRQHFIDTLKPKYLTDKWSVYHFEE